MVFIVKLVGILMVAMGAIYMAKPAVMKKYLTYWAAPQKIYTAAVINIAIGIGFLFAASGCSVPWFIVVVGVISIIKGALGFYLGPKKVIAFIENFQKKPVKKLRIFAIIAIVMGAAILYSV